LIPGECGIEKCLEFGLEIADISRLKFCSRSPFVCVLFLWTSSFELRRYSHCVGFVEAADCKTASSYWANRSVTASICTVFPCDQEFLLSLLIFSKEKYGMIICLPYFSELNLSERKNGPNAIVALTAHNTPSLMPCDFSTGIVYQCVSVLLTSTRIFNFVQLYTKSALDQV